MTKLADKIEALEGPDRETDHAIHYALGLSGGSKFYTASLDAAMTLVPEQAVWLVRWAGEENEAGATVGEGEDYYKAIGKTPALALCAAALRAREANR